MSLKPWERISSRRHDSLGIFDLRIDKTRSPRTGEVHDFYVLESMDWVNVIPLTPDERIVLIRQYRHGTGEITLEIPGGIVERGDSPAEAARRELMEETGYEAEEIIPIGMVHPNPAFLNNRCHTFVAKGATRAGSQAQDEKEDIEVLLKPLAAVPGLMLQGQITHALILAAFYRFYMEYLPGQAGMAQRA